MKNNNNIQIKFPSFYELVQYALIVLKLLSVIQQPWYLIFIPTYIALGVLAVILILVGLIALIDASKNNKGK